MKPTQIPRRSLPLELLPPQASTYALWLYLPRSQDLVIGKLGHFHFPAGDYVYLGSARGPGGLRARLGRHLRGEGKFRWHIDYLRAAAQVRGFGYVLLKGTGQISTECCWSQKLATLPGAQTVVPGFGASDCRSGCAAHLVHIPTLDVDQITSLLNCEIHIWDDISPHPAV